MKCYVTLIDRFLSQFLMARPKLNTVTLDFSGEDGVHGGSLVNIPRALSLVNRRSYCQGYVYSVDYIEFITDQTGQEVLIAKVPENYNTLGAYRLGFDSWRHQRAMAIAETDIEPGKWSDFKPYFNTEHALATLPEFMVEGMGAGFILQDLDVTGSEWNYADMEINDAGAATTTRYSICMIGSDDIGANIGCLLEAWADTRSATVAPDPLTPNVASQSWITSTGAASDAMTGEVIQLIEGENEFPPYANQEDPLLPPTYVGGPQSAPNGMMVDQSVTGNTGRAIVLNGGLFPLGYLVV